MNGNLAKRLFPRIQNSTVEIQKLNAFRLTESWLKNGETEVLVGGTQWTAYTCLRVHNDANGTRGKGFVEISRNFVTQMCHGGDSGGDSGGGVQVGKWWWFCTIMHEVMDMHDCVCLFALCLFWEGNE